MSGIYGNNKKGLNIQVAKQTYLTNDVRGV